MVRGSRFATVIGIDAVLDGLRNVNASFQDEWVVGSPLDYSLFLEVGTSRMPPYPWLGPAANQVISSELSDVLTQVDASEQTVEFVAKQVAAQARFNVQAASSGRRSPGTHPSHPQVRTGQLLESIEAVQA